MEELTFVYPWLALITGILYGLLTRWWRRGVLLYPTVKVFGAPRKDWRLLVRKGLRGLALLGILGALARPQWVRWERVRTKGVDIVLAMDISGSMLASDFIPSRMEAAKEVIGKFVKLLRKQRSGDRLGLVVFAGESYTQCPLTDDYEFLLEAVIDVRNAREGIVRDGTAIGDGLLLSVHRLRKSPVKSKVIILLSDGANNAGRITPRTAAQFAKEYGIRVYTIGIGTEKGTITFTDPLTGRVTYGRISRFDEELLREIARITGGAYFYAGDPTSLNLILRHILRLETTPTVVKRRREVMELGGWFALLALIGLLLEGIFVHTLWQRVP